MFSEGNLVSVGPVPELRRLIATVYRGPTVCRALLYIHEARLNSQLTYGGTCCYCPHPDDREQRLRGVSQVA